MCCGLALLAAVGPRITLILIWLLTDRIGAAFGRGAGGFVLPILGFVFLPLTTVIYLFVFPGGLSGLDWLLLIIGILVDLGSYGGGAYGRRRRR